ncbi:MAG TPA: AbrB/MazE/SpoVT family DNA-binding domain-containing protein [Geminicoccaceae bacterium]|nr:AbrB/MazE/SpoVT family DNA-binding domain-containing protein [Geminicoccaceae bacterium]
MVDLKLRKIGNSCGVVLPKEVLGRLRLAEGDRLFLTETPDGGYRITPYDPEFALQIELAEEGMARYRNTLRALAK